MTDTTPLTPDQLAALREEVATRRQNFRRYYTLTMNTVDYLLDMAEQGQRAERPYDDAADHQYGAWETDDMEEYAHDLLAIVRHRRAALNGDPR